MPPSATSWKGLFQRYKEPLAGLLLLAGVLWAIGASRQLTRAQQVLWWGVLLLAWAVLLRRGWLQFFGPVLFYDLVRIARRSRYALMRGLYAVFLLLMLLSVYSSFQNPHWEKTIEARRMAAFAEAFFFTFMGVQFLAVGLLTPAYTAGAIAEERERQTLEFLLATDLRNREIVLSKQVARLANMTLLILTGLPILAMTQFLGGVDPDLLLAGFAATGLTMMGLGSLSILCSVYAQKPRNAIVLTYLTMAAYLAVSGILSLAPFAVPRLTGLALTRGEDPIIVQDLVAWISIANPFVILPKVSGVLSGRSALADVVPNLLRDYAVFHGVVTVVCTGWAVLRLRGVALKQTRGRRKKLAWNAGRRERPYTGDQPMVWKEVTLDPGLQLNWFGRIAILLLILASFVPPIWFGVYFFQERTGNWQEWRVVMNGWVRVVGTLVACLTLLGVAVRASSSISGERDRQTFDSLLTTPLDSDDMLYGKWLGSIVSVRWGWVWLGLIWGLGLVTGGLHLLAVPLLAAAWGVYAAFLSSLGLYFSTACRTTLRANMATLGVTLGLAAGHWLLSSCCLALMMPGAAGSGLEHVFVFQAFALTPPVTLGGLAFYGPEFEWGRRDSIGEIMLDCILGLVIWGLGAVLLWGMASQQFRLATGRQRIPHPRKPSLDQPGAMEPGNNLTD
jgi:ABC-type transport system involved in multi-copper enzyme maturation permease subunit